MLNKENSSEINPWNIVVTKIPKVNEYVDSVQILKNHGAKKIGTKVDGVTESVNALLPLLKMSDKNLLPIFRSKLFKLAFTYNCLGNDDYLAEDCYEALHIKVILALINTKGINFDQDLLDRVFLSYEVLTQDDLKHKKFLEDISTNFEKFLVECTDELTLNKLLITILMDKEKFKSKLDLFFRFYLYNKLETKFKNKLD